MWAPVAMCFGTAAPASLVLHGVHHGLTVVGILAVAWLIAPASWVRRAYEVIGGPDHRAATVWTTVAVTASAAAALVHLLVVPGHLRPGAGPVLGPGFAAVALLQGGWAYALVRATRSPQAAAGPATGTAPTALLGLGLALHGAALTVWLLSRTVGLPEIMYPGPVPAVGAPDLVAVLWQLTALVAVLVLLRTRVPAPEPLRGRALRSSADLQRWTSWPPASRLLTGVAGGSLVSLVAVGGLL